MFPDRLFLAVVAALVVAIATSLPAQGWRARSRNVAIGLAVAAMAVAGAIVFGAIMHSALFGEPVMID